MESNHPQSYSHMRLKLRDPNLASSQQACAAGATGNSLQDLGTQFGSATAAAQEATSSLVTQASDSASSAFQQLPPDVQEALLAIYRPASKVHSNKPVLPLRSFQCPVTKSNREKYY